MRSMVVACLLLAGGAAPASAETKVAVGASANWMKPRESALGGTRTVVTPTLGLAPKKGFGPTYGLNWFEQRIALEGIGGPAADGKLHIRPVMLGASYTFGAGGTLLSLSVVGGYAFNTIDLLDETRRGPGEISIANSTVVRPGVRLWQSLHEHFGLSFFGGYVYTRPTITIDGVERTLKADYTVLSAGAAFVF